MPIDRSPERAASAHSIPEAADQHSLQPNRTRSSIPVPSSGNLCIEATQAVRLPPFWKGNPQLWFAQVEAAFVINRITSDETKFRYVTLHLDPSVLPLVADIITSPPDGDRYAAIKERLVSVLGETSASRLRKLLASHELGDDKPSILLQRLRNLAEGQVTDGVLRTIFLEQMPESTRAILAISEVSDLNKLAIQADKILEMAKPVALAVQPITAESAISKETAEAGAISKMATEIAALTKQVAALTKQARGRSRSKSKDRRSYRGQTRSKSRNREADAICYFHRRFGAKAFKCEKPCEWKNDNKTEN